MPETTKPIKRSPHLAPLSREHHEGLLFVWKLRQGLAKNIEAARITAFVHWFRQHHLATHFDKEEQALPPVLSTAHPAIQQLFQEHITIKKLIEEIEQYGDLKKLELLAQLLNDHIRFEERQLFNEVEKRATPEQLRTLSEQLNGGKTNAVWVDEFWTR